jgi:hypothetical protein
MCDDQALRTATAQLLQSATAGLPVNLQCNAFWTFASWPYVPMS